MDEIYWAGLREAAEELVYQAQLPGENDQATMRRIVRRFEQEVEDAENELSNRKARLEHMYKMRQALIQTLSV
jgi:hypothetical protein